MTQGTLFPMEDVQVLHEDGLECNNCGIVQPVENFQRMQSGEIKRKCRSCARNQSNLIKEWQVVSVSFFITEPNFVSCERYWENNKKITNSKMVIYIKST